MKRLASLFLILALFSLAACQPSEPPKDAGDPPGTVAGENTPTPAPTEGNPACAMIDEAIQSASNRGRSSSVPVAPNETLLAGTVRCFREVESGSLNVQPAMTLYLTAVEITNPGDVEGRSNRLAGKAGETVVVISKKSVATETGKSIEIHVEFRGDEFGGAYWAMEP